MPAPSLWRDSEGSPLAERHEQLRRTSQALWHLLKARLDLSDEELRRMAARIEAEAHANSSRSPIIDCRVCFRPMQTTARCCLYCGTAPTMQLHPAELRGALAVARNRSQ